MRGVLVVMVLVLFVACGGASTGETLPIERSPTSTSIDNLGGDGLPVQIPGEDYGRSVSPMTGTLHLEPTGCWMVDLGDEPRLVVFPPRFDKPSDDGAVMTSPDGQRFADGDVVDAEGLIIGATSLPGGPDGFWASYVGFCAPGVAEVAVLNTVEPAFNPTEADDGGWREMLETANLNLSWDCGFGFQLSTEDQRIALRIHPSDMEQASPTPSLPDLAWEADLILGKHLQVNNCDDVVEGWEPVPQIVSVWPITGGSLSFVAPAQSGCGAAEPVTATLEGITVTTPSGEVELGDLEAVNEAYGCFAG